MLVSFQLLPEEITIGSNKKVWWKCVKCGCSYYKKIVERNNGQGCPVCTNKIIVENYNDFATLNPEIAKEWHPTKNANLLPSKMTSGSDKRVWWYCSDCGYEWEASIYSRVKLQTGCPACAGKIVIIGKNDLQTTHPQLVSEWNYDKNEMLLPENVSEGSNCYVWWKCSKGHEWQARICTRSQGRGCPICAQDKRTVSREKTILNKRGNLLETNPKVATQWHPTLNGELTPDKVSSGSSKKVWWRCSKGHEWQAIIYSRTRGGGCPVCVGELSTSFPEQTIVFYLSQVSKVINRYKLNGYEIDIKGRRK